MDRRDFLTSVAAVPFVTALRPAPATAAQASTPARARMPIKQSVMASVWGNGSTLSFEDRCKILAKIGFKGVDLPTPEQVPILKQYGLAPALMTGAGTTFQDGLIRKELHEKFEAAFGSEIRPVVSGKRGIVAFDKLLTGYTGSGHVDLFDGEKLSDSNEWYPCQKLHLWYI